MYDAEEWLQADEEVRKNLPQGIKLIRTLRGHSDYIGRIAWSPDGRTLATTSSSKIRLWDVETGKCLFILDGHRNTVNCIAFDPLGHIMASGSYDESIMLWEPASGKLLFTLKQNAGIRDLVFGSLGQLISGSLDCISLWNTKDGHLLKTFLTQEKGSPEIISLAIDSRKEILAAGSNYGFLSFLNLSDGSMRTYKGNDHGFIESIAFSPDGRKIAFAGGSTQIFLSDVTTGSNIRTLELHTDSIISIGFSSDGNVIAAKGMDSIVSLWKCDSGALLTKISSPYPEGRTIIGSLTFHPFLPRIAVVNSDSNGKNIGCTISIFEYDLDVLLQKPTIPTITYTSAKIVLVGNSGVGKTGLGWRLAHGEFKEHSSTHGQQFWLLNQLCKQRRDGAQCEAVLWDLAGQPDYRLIHALFLDDADLALVLFDPTNDDPLRGIEFWLKQLKINVQPPNGTPTVLIAARSDRGVPRFTLEEINTFCEQRGIKAYILTSAKSGEGVEELVQQMQNMILWDDKPATVTTETFKRIKDFVLGLKEDSRSSEVILTQEELRQRLEKTDSMWKFSEAEMLTAVGHLENHGYVIKLKTSHGETRILLAPELLNNLAASFVLEARRNPKGLGSLEEKQLLSGEYKFPELEKLAEAEKDILRDSVTVLFLEHNICFRETDPLNSHTYLVFPELINLKKPLIEDDLPTEDGVAYTVSGAVENVYASLVVLMGYTQTFTRTNQWHDHARYEVGEGFVCGLRLENERAGELDLVLYFGTDTPDPVRKLFQNLFENFMIRRNLTVQRYDSVICPKGHKLNLSVVRQKISSGAKFAFCS